MRMVSAREANQAFSELLQTVVEGEEVAITRRGKPVARLAPSRTRLAMPSGRRRSAGIQHWREGIDLGEPVAWTRDELHER